MRNLHFISLAIVCMVIGCSVFKQELNKKYEYITIKRLGPSDGDIPLHIYILKDSLKKKELISDFLDSGYVSVQIPKNQTSYKRLDDILGKINTDNNKLKKPEYYFGSIQIKSFNQFHKLVYERTLVGEETESQFLRILNENEHKNDSFVKNILELYIP